MKKTFHWRDNKSEQIEHLSADISDTGIKIESFIVNHGAEPFGCHYKIECNRNWQFRYLLLQMDSAQTTLEIKYDYENWFINGSHAPALHDARDIDLSFSPFTNSLPINRLKLNEGLGTDITAAYVTFPDLDIRPDRQRYTRLSKDIYRYQSLASDFQRDVTVDPEGFVLDYPGLFTRFSAAA